MIALDRTQRSLFARWWWTVDRPMLGGLLVLALAGVVFVFAASPPVADRLGVPSLHFATRHLIYLGPALLLLFGTSLLSPRGVYRLAVGLLAVGLLLLALTLVTGFEVKGATRWLPIAGIVIQPSEFVKPALIVVVASLLARAPGLANARPALGLVAVVVGLLLAQPDVGMTLMVIMVTALQLFLAGLPWLLVIVTGVAMLAALYPAATWFPHVAERIERFLDPGSGDSYQVDRALEAVRGAEWLGSGPGEGQVKYHLPDAHSDFVFAVVVEEYGLVVALALMALFGFLLLRGLLRVGQAQDRFTLIAAAGLLCHFGLQALINLGVTLAVVPTTGMTLPFISYGGSSLCALSLAMGLFLALTRRRATLAGLP
jgi:cell division protein FtsW